MFHLAQHDLFLRRTHVILVPRRLALLRSASLKSGITLVFFSLDSFQTLTSCLRIARCSSFAMFPSVESSGYRNNEPGMQLSPLSCWVQYTTKRAGSSPALAYHKYAELAAAMSCPAETALKGDNFYIDSNKKPDQSLSLSKGGQAHRVYTFGYLRVRLRSNPA